MIEVDKDAFYSNKNFNNVDFAADLIKTAEDFYTIALIIQHFKQSNAIGR